MAALQRWALCTSNSRSSTVTLMSIESTDTYRSNFYVLTTCSPHNFDLVKSYGADYVVDYNSSTSITDLLAHAETNKSTMGPLTLCLDTISTEETALCCSKVLKPDQKRDHMSKRMYSAIRPFIPPLPGITTFITLGYSFLGEPGEQMGQKHPASQEDFESAKKFAIVEILRMAP
jgi:hypothetical protein